MISGMSARILLLLSAWLLTGSLVAQLIYADSTEVRVVTPEVRIYEDTNRGLTEVDVLALPDSAFRRAERRVPNFKRTESRYWMRLSLRNATGQPLYLLLQNALLKTAHLYVEHEDGTVRRLSSGRSQPYTARDLVTTDISFALGRRPRTLLLAMDTDNFFFVPAFVAAPPALVADRHYLDLFNGAFLGIVIAMLLFNLFIYVTTRERIYLYYVIYVTFQALMMLRLRGLGFELLWPAHPGLNDVPLLYASLTIFALTLFSTRFLDTKRHVPRFHYWLWGLTALNGIFLLTAAVGWSMGGTLLQLTSLTCTFSLFFGSAYMAWRGSRPAVYFLIVWSFPLVCTIILILALNGVIEITFWTLGAAQIGSSLRAVLLSIAVAARINTYKAERAAAQQELVQQTRKKEQLVREQNTLLEEKVARRTQQLKAEKAKSDELLLNILPAAVAEELKQTGRATPRLHEQVSVMFIDIQEFTQYSEQVSPEELVGDIDRLFRGFDRIIKRHGVEKIKTIGDAYLCVAGLPAYHENHALSLLRAARDIVDFVETEQRKGKFFQVRVGLHCGPVVAGVVGESKFAYDIWGDTVNVAARMEQHSEKGRINVSEDFYSHVKERGRFVYRGKVAAKHKGAVDMYFVEGLKAELERNPKIQT